MNCRSVIVADHVAHGKAARVLTRDSPSTISTSDAYDMLTPDTEERATNDASAMVLNYDNW